MEVKFIDKGRVTNEINNIKQKREDCQLLLIFKKGYLKKIVKKKLIEEVKD